MIDAKFSNAQDLNLIRADLEKLPIGNFEIQEFGSPDNILIKIENSNKDDQMSVINSVKVYYQLMLTIEELSL